MLGRLLAVLAVLGLLWAPVPSQAAHYQADSYLLQALDGFGGGGGGGPLGCGTGAPAPAAAAGLCVQTLKIDQTFSAANVDASHTYASGFSLYLYNHFGISPTTGASITFPGDGSVTVYGNGSGGGLLTTTGAKAGVAPGYVGTGYRTSFYACATFALTGSPPSTSADGWPSWWYESLLHVRASAMTDNTIDHWAGAATGYEHFAEDDFLEYFGTVFGNNANFFGKTQHDWYGIFGSTCSPSNYCDGDSRGSAFTNMGSTFFTGIHQYCNLNIAATATTPGSSTLYIDGVLTVDIGPAGTGTKTWTQFLNSGTQLPTPNAQTWLYGVDDTDYASLTLGGSIQDPMRVYDIDVWQATAANNVVN